MPVGTCDPATRSQPYNVIQIAEGNGDVFITIRYGWDGRSQKESEHTVTAGQTLADIAALYGATETEMRTWNNLPDSTISVGQILTVWKGGCDGPLVNGSGGGNVWAISYVNAGAITYYMHTIGRNGQARTFTVNPGANGTITKAQAANNGYVNRSDVDDLSLTTTP